MKLTKDVAIWLQKVRGEWYDLADPFGAGRAALFPKYPQISQVQLNGTRVFTDRIVAMEKTFPKGGRGIEVGTQTGRVCKLLRKHTSPRQLLLLDIEDQHIKSANPDLLTASGVELIIQDSAVVLPSLEREAFDWIYIDANHDYSGVKIDLENAASLVKPDGIIALNDYTVWSPLEMWPYGVVEVVHEFLSRHACLSSISQLGTGLRRHRDQASGRVAAASSVPLTSRVNLTSPKSASIALRNSFRPVHESARVRPGGNFDRRVARV